MSDKESRNYLSFRVGHQWYGVDVTQVIEVLQMLALIELPGAAPEVLGLMIVRETVMPAIDLRRLFGLSEFSLRLNTPIIALWTDNSRATMQVAGKARKETGAIALVVDEVDDVEYVAAEQCSRYDGDSPYVMGVARLEGRLLLVLDTMRLNRETKQTSVVDNETGNQGSR